MRDKLLLSTALLGCIAPLSKALAHFGLADGEEIGHGIFWVYGLVFTTLIGFVFYQRWARGKGTIEQRSLRLQLKELDRALHSCLKQIQNADDYPNECGLSKEQRNENMASVLQLQSQIDQTKEMLSAT
jgi:hypothetical protein